MVSFVGAGPGDPELITVKGLARLRKAAVVVHDRLIAADLLQEADPDAEVVDVGKTPGRHCTTQSAINALLVDRASRGNLVVRLKGGDPSVFGRLGEEIHALRSAGIPFDVVPGVTAGCVAAAHAGISLTERQIASTIVIATGTCHASAEPPALDWPLLARLDGTLVFYMAVRSLERIAGALLASGRDPRTAAIVVERVSMAGERVISADLETIAAAAREARVASPATLVIGPTAGARRGESHA